MDTALEDLAARRPQAAAVDAATVEIRRRTIADTMDGIVAEEARPPTRPEAQRHSPVFAVALATFVVASVGRLGLAAANAA